MDTEGSVKFLLILGGLFAPLLVSTATGPPSRAVAASPAFPRPASLEPAVAFWKDVFTRWDQDQVVYADAFDLSRVYEVHRLPPSDGTRARERMRDALRSAWKNALADDLLRLADPKTDYDRLQGRLRRLYLTWDEARDPELYRRAAETVRGQRGLREEFLAGVQRSAAYRRTFRRIFREEGVPEELVYLPYVESSYREDARSAVGATGMWQFMRSTARRYMLVNEAVDERLDPYRAARAAARYLKEAYAELGSWPLAITSYNHGVDGMKNAVRETGTTDIGVIVRTYRGPLFGFAGRNFYAEFLAARDASDSILARRRDIVLSPPASFDSFRLPAYVKLSVLARALSLPRDEIRRWNPALTPAARASRVHLPRNFTLRLPPGTGDEAPRRFAAIPSRDRPLTPPPKTYRVRRGDNLGLIAARFRTTVRTLQRMNHIRNPHRIRAGSVLRLPH